MLKPPKIYMEYIVVAPELAADYTARDILILDDSSGRMVSSDLSPRIMLNGNVALPSWVSRVDELSDEMRDRLFIARGPMLPILISPEEAENLNIKVYTDTQILSCCDFTDHTNYHREE